jgi:hypothetical protein
VLGFDKATPDHAREDNSMTTDQTNQPDATPEDGPEDGPQQGEAPQEPTKAVATYRDPYDTAEPVTLRDRIIYARELANSGLLPRDYVGKPANVLVAAELGAQMGLAPIQAVLMLNVVEGRPSLGANGVRAVVARAGHHMGAAEITYNQHGVPTEASVTGWRAGEEDRPVTITWNLRRAERAGLCRLRWEDGEVIEVRARSSQDKVLPWEAYTEDMLDARATTKLGRTLFGDVTMGLSYEREELDPPSVVGEVVGSAPAQPSARAEQVLQQVKPQRRTDLPDDYDPHPDLDEAGATWWEHAGAQVSRRNKQQLAADRLAKWVADNPGKAEELDVPLPGENEAGLPPRRDDVVDAEVVEEDASTQTADPNEPDDPWAAARPDDAEPGVADEPVVEEPPADLPPQDQVGDDAPDLGGDVTRDELLAEIEAAADEIGKSRQAVMVRWIATHRKNPEEATAEELLPFVEQLRQTMAARRG